ncbi:ribonuclease HI, partial [Kocuria sp. UBA1838]
MTIIASADGSALGNPGPAGWAWYIDPTSWRAGGWAHGTNNMGELTAVLDLLRSTRHRADEPLRVLCDSQYVINSVTKWMPGWKKKGWKKRDGKPVLNVEIMKALDRELSGRDVSFEWVKGHAGHELNEAADERARAMATAYQSGTAPEDMPVGPGFRNDAGRGIEAGDVEPDLFSAWASSEDLPAGHAGSTDSTDS